MLSAFLAIFNGVTFKDLTVCAKCYFKDSILHFLIVQEFNGSKFVVFTSLLLFSLLYTLKLDNVLDWSWWSVFIPLWVWKAVAISGAGVGSYVWWRRPQSRLNNEEYIQYKAGVLRSIAEG